LLDTIARSAASAEDRTYDEFNPDLFPKVFFLHDVDALESFLHSMIVESEEPASSGPTPPFSPRTTTYLPQSPSLFSFLGFVWSRCCPWEILSHFLEVPLSFRFAYELHCPILPPSSVFFFPPRFPKKVSLLQYRSTTPQ